MNNTAEININSAATALKEEIDTLERKIREAEDRLRSVQDECLHPGVEVYRMNYRVGVCSICLCKFSTTRQVDLIFAE